MQVMHKFTGAVLFISLWFSSCHKDSTVTVIPPPVTRQSVPIYLKYGRDANRTVTAYITVYVNGVKLNIAFDTGSTGFRVVQGAVSGVPITLYNESISYAYGNHNSNNEDYLGITGVAARGSLTFSQGGPATPVKLMLIESAVINTGSPFATTTVDTLGGGYRGMNGLMGVGFRQSYNDSISSSLAQLPGGGKFIVSLPTYLGSQGTLIISPNPADMEGFLPINQLDSGVYHLPNGFKSWNDAAVPGIATIGGVAYAQPTLLDIGNALIWVYNEKGFSKQSFVGAGSAVGIAVSAFPGGPPLVDTTFTVQSEYSGKDWVETNNIENASSFGIQFFFTYDVMFDPKNGIISVRKKQ